jgi:hypothetical protein
MPPSSAGSVPPDALPDRPLRFHPLRLLDDGEDTVVGRPDVDSHLVLPADGAALLRRLHGGAAPGDAARWYEEQYGQAVDRADFLDSLHHLDLLADDGVTAGDGWTDPAPDAVGPRSTVRYQRLGAAVFSRPRGRSTPRRCWPRSRWWCTTPCWRRSTGTSSPTRSSLSS